MGNDSAATLPLRKWSLMTWIVLAITGMVVLVAFYCIDRLSNDFIYGEGYRERPILSFIAWMTFAFVGYVIAITHLLKIESDFGESIKGSGRNKFLGIGMGWILTVTVVARILLFTSQPIQEIDYKRYLWDGAVLSSGVNPYRFAPNEIDLSESELYEADDSTYTKIDLENLEKLQTLRNSSPDANSTHYWINWPEVRTIYPPLAQIVFVINHKVAPWSLQGLRVLFFLFEMGTLFFIFDSLRRLKMPTHRILIYAWSPLVIKEMINSTHLDAIVVCCLAFSIWSWVSGRYKLLGVALGLGVLAKTFPVVLLPVALMAVARRKGVRQALALGGIFIGVVLAGYVPFYMMDGDHIFDGHKAFAAGWTQNESFFALTRYVATLIKTNVFCSKWIELLSVAMGRKESLLAGDLLARTIFGCSFLFFGLGVALWPERKRRVQAQSIDVDSTSDRNSSDDRYDPLTVPARWLLLIAVLFLASPTGNPWYVTWLIPMLCFCPVRGLILLTGMVPLYYLSFFTQYHESFYMSVGTTAEHEFSRFQWIEFLPVYAVLLADGLMGCIRRKKQQKAKVAEIVER